MDSPESVGVAAQLDQHHLPETNGRMPVCRRCGARTDNAAGTHHVLKESQVSSSSDWLVAQSRMKDIERARMMRTG
jgi:hypothetical protein